MTDLYLTNEYFTNAVTQNKQILAITVAKVMEFAKDKVPEFMHNAMNTWRSGGKIPHIFNLGIRQNSFQLNMTLLKAAALKLGVVTRKAQTHAQETKLPVHTTSVCW